MTKLNSMVPTVRVNFVDAIVAQVTVIATDDSTGDALKIANVRAILSVLDMTFFDSPAAVPVATRKLYELGCDHPLLAECVGPSVLRLVKYQRELLDVFCLSTSVLYVPPGYVLGSDLDA